jgi:hypothetical protein
MKFTEKCACGASMSAPMPPNAGGEWADWAMAQLKEWRTTHIHEIQPEAEYPEPPTVVESMSNNERAQPFGFTREEQGDLA